MKLVRILACAVFVLGASVACKKEAAKTGKTGKTAKTTKTTKTAEKTAEKTEAAK